MILDFKLVSLNSWFLKNQSSLFNRFSYVCISAITHPRVFFGNMDLTRLQISLRLIELCLTITVEKGRQFLQPIFLHGDWLLLETQRASIVVLNFKGVIVAISAPYVLLLVMQVLESAADGLVCVNIVLKSAMISLE